MTIFLKEPLIYKKIKRFNIVSKSMKSEDWCKKITLKIDKKEFVIETLSGLRAISAVYTAKG